MAIKNQALTVSFFAWDTGNSVGKTGDSANITMYVAIDGSANAVDDTSVAEVDSTNLQGVYTVDLTAPEMNGNHILVGGESTTADIVIVPISITTERGDLATVDTNVDSILTDTGTTLPAEHDALFTTAISESYSTDGSTMTIAQALYMITSFLFERNVSSTTVTTKKVDGSTGSMTFTLDDDTTPTQITRAT